MEEAERKRLELENIIKSHFSNLNISGIDEISKKIVEFFAAITAPEIDVEKETGIGFIIFVGNNNWF